MSQVKTLTTANPDEFVEQLNLIAFLPSTHALIGVAIVTTRYWLFWRATSYSVSWRE